MRRLVAARERRLRALQGSYSYRFGHAVALGLTAPLRLWRKVSVFLSAARCHLSNRWRRLGAAPGAAAGGPRSRRTATPAAGARRPLPAAPPPGALPEPGEPLPAAWVAGNRWTDLEPPELGRWTPSRTVSVIVPYYRAQPALEITLAALARQTYPRHLTQVIVADDGSPEPPAVPPGLAGLEVEVVRQPRHGFGLARARNAGAAAAVGEILLFLDGDMVPEPRWLEAHARWHHLVADAVSLGFRRHVDFSGIAPADVASAAADGALEPLFAGREQQRPEWIEVHLQRMENLTSGHDDLFRIACGGNLGLRAETFAAVGGCDGSFVQWGAEDIELGYRLFTYGALFVPERGALCWHQGLNREGAGQPDAEERRSLEQQRAKIAHLIAQRSFRRQRPGRSFRVPHAVVRIDVSSEPRQQVVEAVEAVLASRFHDFVACLTVPDDHPDSVWLRRQFSGDPRLRVGAELDDRELFPFAAVRVRIAPWIRVSPATLGSLLDRLWRERLGVLTVSAPEDPERPDPGRPDPGRPDPGRPDPGRPDPGGRDPVRLMTTRAWRRTSRLAPGPEDVEPLAAELFGAARWTAREAAVRGLSGRRLGAGSWIRGSTAKPPREPSPPDAGPLPPIDLEQANPIGFRRAAGGRFAAVASCGLGDGWRQLAEDLRDAVEGPVDVFELESLEARPPLSRRLWTRFAAWPRRLLPRRRGVRRLGRRAELRRLIRQLRRYRAVVDHPALHRRERRRARTLAALAAAGVPLAAPSLPPTLRQLLGEPLAAALDAVALPALADPDERERTSVRLRRAALSEHHLRARHRRIAELAGGEPWPGPRVSVLLAIHRPEFLDHAVRQVGRQTWRPLELVLALHGDGFPAGVEERLSERVGCGFEVVRLGSEKTLGAVLNAAVEASSGELLTKMDSDDWYAADHVLDLALALEYSRAMLVGKGAELVYLRRSDVTIRRYEVGAETANLTLGGGALMIRRSDLAAAGGWRDVPEQVDRGLIEDVMAAGGSVFRTHGFGYLLHRHGSGHTWGEGEEYFLRHAVARRPGLDLRFAGIEDDGPRSRPAL